MRVLITGTSGLLGSGILKHIPADWEVTAWVNTHTVLPAMKVHKVNLLNEREVMKAIDECKPQMVLHLAALADTSFCQQNPKESEKMNFLVPKLLAGLCADRNAAFTFTSTDLVFDGLLGNYTEYDEPNPLSQYAEDKLMAEETIRKILPTSLVIRLSLLIGLGIHRHSGYLSKFLHSMYDLKKQSLYHDEYRTPIGIHSAAKSIIKLSGKHSGLLHLGGNERMSRWELGLRIAKLYSLDENLITKTSSDDYMTTVMRPKDVSLNSSKASLLGVKVLDLFDELSETK